MLIWSLWAANDSILLATILVIVNIWLVIKARRNPHSAFHTQRFRYFILYNCGVVLLYIAAFATNVYYLRIYM